VAPSSLVKNWCKEFTKWLGGLVRTVGIDAPDKKGEQKLYEFELSYAQGGHDVLVISYDQFRKYANLIYKIQAVDLLVCDEGHRLKNSQIKTTEALNQLKTKRRVILSGTPIQVPMLPTSLYFLSN